MPWSETSAMDERMRFVLAASENEAVMAEICAEFGISRQSGYKWLARYRAEGAEGLKERSRAPIRHGRARDEELVAAVLALRERHPTWGPKKRRRTLTDRSPEIAAPARVRAAACDPLGQRAAVRLDRRGRAVEAFGVVDQARRASRTDRSRQAAAERPP